jgi:hypothetical protein
MPYLLVLFSFPLIYYFTSPEVYYRRPIDPIMVVLAVYGVIGSEKEEPENRKPGKFARLAETPES